MGGGAIYGKELWGLLARKKTAKGRKFSGWAPVNGENVLRYESSRRGKKRVGEEKGDKNPGRGEKGKPDLACESRKIFLALS